MRKLYLLPITFFGILSYGQTGGHNAASKSTLNSVGTVIKEEKTNLTKNSGVAADPLKTAELPQTVGVIINGLVRQMMVYNLGANPAMNPNSPQQGTMGNYYQWGTHDPVATAYTDPGGISGWNYRNYAPNKSWNSGTEASPVKTLKDPCPDGFRIPTNNEWDSFHNSSSSHYNIGTWAVDGYAGATNFTAAKVYINNSNIITLPAAGTRVYNNGGGYSGAQ
ncbi:hypothetical protein OWR28_14515 [Chryseobacterium sp. 1B4]